MLYFLVVRSINFVDGVSVTSVTQPVMIFFIMVAEYNWTTSGRGLVECLLATIDQVEDVHAMDGALLMGGRGLLEAVGAVSKSVKK